MVGRAKMEKGRGRMVGKAKSVMEDGNNWDSSYCLNEMILLTR